MRPAPELEQFRTRWPSAAAAIHLLFPNPVGFFARGRLSPRNRTPNLSGAVHTTCTSRFVPSKVSTRKNCFGSHSLLERMSRAPPLERSAIRQENALPLASSMRPGRLTGCLVSLRMNALNQRLQVLRRLVVPTFLFDDGADAEWPNAPSGKLFTIVPARISLEAPPRR